MKSKTYVWIHTQGFRAAYLGASVGLTARAMGDEVTFVLAFGALTDFLGGQFGTPARPDEEHERERALANGAAPPDRMLTEARAAGARVVACETMLALVDGQTPGLLDEIVSLVELVRDSSGARCLSF